MKIRMRRRLVGVLVAAGLGALPFAIGGPALAAKPSGATFNPNLLLQGSSNTAEPSIRTDRFGHSFVIGPTGVPAGCKAWRVTHNGSSATYIGQPDHTAGGGDCDWAMGPQETSSTISPAPTDEDLAYSSLSLANITTGKSDDGGSTFGPPNVYSQQVGGDDRMWMAADPRLNSGGFADIFMTYHDVSGPEDIQMGVSIDGGFSYVQNAPIINNTDVPVGQWQGAGLNVVGAGNELGNIVARRTAAGLTLYSIFETPDSATDNTNQAIAGTANYNRVYEAVGTVAVDTAPPVISWRNYEIYHGPLGARYNRIFPVTAVDNGGRVYAFWTDGNHIDYKADATGTGWRASKAPSQIANPSGVNTALMPWAQASAPGYRRRRFLRCLGRQWRPTKSAGRSQQQLERVLRTDDQWGRQLHGDERQRPRDPQRAALHRRPRLQPEQPNARSDPARFLPDIGRSEQRRSGHRLCGRPFGTRDGGRLLHATMHRKQCDHGISAGQ